MDSQTARQGPHYCSDLHAHAQCPLQVDQAYSSAPEGSTTAPPGALHAAAGPCGIGRERRSLRGDARGSARRLWGPRREVSQRRVGSALAGWPGNAVLHAFSRSPPSRAGVYARASARIPVADRGDVRDLELGKAVERVRVAWRPRLRFLRNRSRAQAARDGLLWWRHRAPAVGVVVEAPGGGSQKRAPGSRVWEGAAGTWPEPSPHTVSDCGRLTRPHGSWAGITLTRNAHS